MRSQSSSVAPMTSPAMHTVLCNSSASSCSGDATIRIPNRGTSNGQNSQLFQTPHPPPMPLSVITSSTRCVGIPYAIATNADVRHRHHESRNAVCPNIRAVSNCWDSAPSHCATTQIGLSITSGSKHPKVSHRHGDRKSTRLNSSHGYISYAVFCLKKKKKKNYL